MTPENATDPADWDDGASENGDLLSGETSTEDTGLAESDSWCTS